MQRVIARAVAPLARRIANVAARGVVTLVNAASKMQGLQVRLLANEVKDGLEHFETYGFTASPKTGAEALVLFLGGDRSHGIVVATPDRRFRLTGLEEGEVALYDDQGKFIKLARDGIVISDGVHQINLNPSGVSIDSGGSALHITNAPSIRFETPRLEVTGEIVAPNIYEGSV